MSSTLTGTSISLGRLNYPGTAGPIVRIGNDTLVVSCFHVLVADAGRAQEGDPIVQSETGTAVAKLYRTSAMGARADAAMAVLDTAGMWSNNIKGLDIHPTKIAERSDIHQLRMTGAKVLKSGSVSSVTEGTIEEENAEVEITYPLRPGDPRKKKGQLRIQGSNGPFSEEGDSGACLISSDGSVLGIVIAGKGNDSWATPMYTLREQFHGLSL